MAQLQTLKDRESGQTVYPITSTKAVFDEHDVDLDTLLAQQKQQTADALKDYPNKTEVSQSLAGKQDKLSPTTDVYITNDNIIGLSAEFKNSKLDKSDWDARNDKFTIRGKYIYPTDGHIYSDGTFVITEFIPINRNYDIVVVAQATDNAAALALYDASHQFIGGCSTSRDTIGNVDRNTETNTYTLHATDIPARAAYFRCGTRADLQSRTYSNGPTDESRTGAISNLIADSKLELFIDMWNVACGTYGKYNAKTGYFELNGLTDITYEQALEIYDTYAGASLSTKRNCAFEASKARTNIPFVSLSRAEVGFELSSAWRNSQVEVLNLQTGYSQPCRIINSPQWIFLSSRLKKIVGGIEFVDNVPYFNGFGSELEEVSIKNLRISVKLQLCDKLGLASFRYLVTNAANTAPITVTVHPSVYAKLTGDTTNEAAAALTPEELAQWQQVLTDAVAKNISFATV